MALDELKIGTAQLAKGMYVCRLDRPWSESPFLMQGFPVDEPGQLAWLKQHCQSVWIDVVRGPLPADVPLETLSAGSREAEDPEKLVGGTPHDGRVPLEKELPYARQAHENAARLAARLIEDLRAGQKLSPALVQDAVEPIVESILRSPDTLFWVNALQKHDGYAYSHAINCSALAAALGRHLGLPVELLLDLARGGLLLDLGKSRLPRELLAQPGPLGAEAMARVREHVQFSVQIVEESGEYSPAVIEMIRTHHERWDGSGYAGGRGELAIPLFGRIAGIVDSFDAMTSQRPHAAAIARHEALQQIYRCRDTLYQGELIEQFIGCLGVYPTGSLVELSSGEVAVVMAQNPTRRLRPRVMLLTDREKCLRSNFASLDLMNQDDHTSARKLVTVRTPLPIGAYGLDPAELYL